MRGNAWTRNGLAIPWNGVTIPTACTQRGAQAGVRVRARNYGSIIRVPSPVVPSP